MNLSKRFAIGLVCIATAIAGVELGEKVPIAGLYSIVSTAEARVGRPLTPVSVAGVARRTGRRCATGVYNC